MWSRVALRIEWDYGDSGIVERKAVLMSFVARIEAEPPQGTVTYTIPGPITPTWLDLYSAGIQRRKKVTLFAHSVMP